MTQREMVYRSWLAQDGAETHHNVYRRRDVPAPTQEPMRPVGVRKMPAVRVSRKRRHGKWS